MQQRPSPEIDFCEIFELFDFRLLQQYRHKADFHRRASSMSSRPHQLQGSVAVAHAGFKRLNPIWALRALPAPPRLRQISPSGKNSLFPKGKSPL